MATPVKLTSSFSTTLGQHQYIELSTVSGRPDVGDMLNGKAFAAGSDGTLTPAAGQRGEVIASTVSTAANAAATTAYKALASVALTPGLWLVSGLAQLNVNAATLTQTVNYTVAIGSTTASATGTTAGQTIVSQMQAGLVDPMSEVAVIPPFLLTLTAATTYYLNVACTFSAGTPQWVGSISAVRIA